MSTQTIEEILALPQAEFGEAPAFHRSILFVPTGHMHDTGYSYIAVVGANAEGVGQVILSASCDSVHLPVVMASSDYDTPLRVDMLFPSGITHLWSNTHNFTVEEHTMETMRILAERR